MITDTIKEIEIWVNIGDSSIKYDTAWNVETAAQIVTNLGEQGTYSYAVYVVPNGPPNSSLDQWVINGLETHIADVRDCFGLKCPTSESKGA